jgi:acyl-CoA synthetase (NDP forming)
MADIIASARAQGRLLLTEVESKQLLQEAGIPVAMAHLAKKPKKAVEIADEIGYPVVMKIVSTEITHKSDVGGVVVGLRDAKAVRKAYKEMLERVAEAAPGAKIDGVAIQSMAKQGTEIIVGSTADPQFGPVLMFGLGGVFVEVLKDVAFRVVPIEERDARQMVREIKGLPILEGVRGQDPADLEAIEALLLRVSDFIEAHPEIAELDLNPVFAYSKGAIAVDARIVLTEAAS